MALSGRSSLETTNGRPLCPQGRAPMWTLHMSAFDPRRTSPVNSTTITHLIAELTEIASRRESPPSTSERAEQS